MEENKIYFMPGDMVKLRQNLPNSPIMLVVKKKTYIFMIGSLCCIAEIDRTL